MEAAARGGGGRRITSRSGAAGVWASEAFRKELLAQMSERLGAEHYGGERRGDGGSAGGRDHRGGIEAAAVGGGGSRSATPKAIAAKVALAARLRAETTMTVGWIAERLGMGTRDHLNHLLYRRQEDGRVAAIIKN